MFSRRELPADLEAIRSTHAQDTPVLDAESDPGMYPFDLAFDLVEGEPAIEDGVLSVPDGPGLGVEVNLDVVEAYPFVEGPWTEFRYDE
jgi:L-alanine-DL-glutamate epimerase-like enolase superfamily enzyme